MARTGRAFPIQHHFSRPPFFPPFFLKISGQITLAGVPQAGAYVYLIDATTNNLVARLTTDGSGNYSFTSVYSLDASHLYHVVAEYTNGVTKYNGYSKPYIIPVQN